MYISIDENQIDFQNVIVKDQRIFAAQNVYDNKYYCYAVTRMKFSSCADYLGKFSAANETG